MKPLIAALLLALVASPALASNTVDTTFVKAQGRTRSMCGTW